MNETDLTPNQVVNYPTPPANVELSVSTPQPEYPSLGVISGRYFSQSELERRAYIENWSFNGRSLAEIIGEGEDAYYKGHGYENKDEVKNKDVVERSVVAKEVEYQKKIIDTLKEELRKVYVEFGLTNEEITAVFAKLAPASGNFT
jgi:hypothetical protein